jgi:zinc/manganese transport system permease protein
LTPLVADFQHLLAYDFMRNALLAGTFIALAAGLVGYFAVLRNQVFTSDALGHVAFAGSLGALVLGIQQVLGLFGSTIAVTLGIGALGGRARGRDVVIGAVFAWILGLGALFLSLYTVSSNTSNGAAGVHVLFGSILGIGQSTAIMASVLAAAACVGLLLIARPLLFLSIDPDVAAARGLPTRVLTAAFLLILAITVAEAVQVVGALLIFSLLVTPASVAQRLTTRPYAGLLLSAAIAVGCVWMGLALAFATPWPASFWITAVAFTAFAATHLAPQVWHARRAGEDASPSRNS